MKNENDILSDFQESSAPAIAVADPPPGGEPGNLAADCNHDAETVVIETDHVAAAVEAIEAAERHDNEKAETAYRAAVFAVCDGACPRVADLRKAIAGFGKSPADFERECRRILRRRELRRQLDRLSPGDMLKLEIEAELAALGDKTELTAARRELYAMSGRAESLRQEVELEEGVAASWLRSLRDDSHPETIDRTKAAVADKRAKAAELNRQRDALVSLIEAAADRERLALAELLTVD
jgi:hypothetical protein